MGRGWRTIELTEGGSTRVDPYLHWARMTGFASLGGRRAGPTPWIPVLLELDAPVIEAARDVPAELCEIARIYLEPGPGLARSRFCTAKVSEAFFDTDANPWLRCVVRYEIGLPVLGSGKGVPREVEVEDDVPKPPRPIGPPVLAIIDDVLPFLRSLGGRSHWVDLWDQGFREGRHPEGLPYGTQVLEAGRLTAFDVLETAPGEASTWYETYGMRSLLRRWSHGSAVLGLATAPRAPGDAVGLLPVVGVHLPRTTWEDTSGLSLAVHVLDAMRFVLDSADKFANTQRQPPSPVVANISYGRFAGAHDGSGLLSAALDELLELRNFERRPLAIVLPAGNGQLSRGHARIDALAPGASETLRWRIQPEDFTPSFVELWFDAADIDHVSLHVVSPDGTTGAVSIDDAAVLCDGETVVASVAMLRKSAAGDKAMALLAVQPTATLDPTGMVAPSGTWLIRIENTGAAALDADAWIQRDDVFGPSRLKGRQSRFDDSAYVRFDAQGRMLDVDPPRTSSLVRRTNTLNPIATGRHTVVVGACIADSGRPSRYTASGAAANAGQAGRVPDAMAVSDRSATLGGVPTSGVSPGTVVTAAGSSLAAPQVARWLVEQLADPNGPIPATDPGWAREWVRTAFGGAVAVQAAFMGDKSNAPMTEGSGTSRGEGAVLPAPVADPRGSWR